MDSEKLIKTIFTILFVIFVTIYISQATGYYEYELHKKSELTKEQIQKFEKDVMVVSPDIIRMDGIHQNPHFINRISPIRKLLYRF